MRRTRAINTISLACGILVLVAQAKAQLGVPITAPVPLNTNAASDSGEDFVPQIVTDGLGNWLAVWESHDTLGDTIGVDADILVARSTDNGATWTAPAPLNTNADSDSGHDGDPQFATDGMGNWVTVWWSSESLGDMIGTDWDILVARSTDNGATWTAPAALNSNAETDSGNDGFPQIATDRLGNWVVVWDTNDTLGGTIGTDQDVLIARSTDNGATWTAPVPLNSHAGGANSLDINPKITTDGLGNWLGVWDSDNSLGDTVQRDWDVLVTRSTDNGLTWTAPAPLNSNAAGDTGMDLNGQVSTDGLGNWVAVWWSTDHLGFTIDTDFDILVARSTDNGATWTWPVPLGTNAGPDGCTDADPQVDTDGAGNWVAVWYSSGGAAAFCELELGNKILAALSTDNGATWTAPTPLSASAAPNTSSDRSPQLATDRLGNWAAVWQSRDEVGGTIEADEDILVVRFQIDTGIPTPGDCNGDGAVDLIDYLDFLDCQSSPGGGLGVGCDCFDFDNDNDADLFNFAVFQANYTSI